MTDVTPFTSNYEDHSTQDGYQFEFRCMQCGSGFRSQFHRSATGIGRRLGGIAALGGDLFGGSAGNRASQAGWDVNLLTGYGGGERSRANDKHLAEAAKDVERFFTQCHRCGKFVCRQLCWNVERGLCVGCAPKLDQEVAGMQARAQVDQLNERIQKQDWTQGSNVQDQATGLCAACHQESGGGKFCKSCGTPLAAAPGATARHCGNCGTVLSGAKFCGECGTVVT